MIRIALLLFSLVVAFSAQAQKKVLLNKIYTTEIPVTVSMPYMVDSVNTKGGKFDTKNLLETPITLPDAASFTKALNPDVTYDYFFLPRTHEGARFHFLSFQLTADRYSKLKLKVTSPSMFEVYVDGKKEITKSNVQDSLKLVKVMDADLTMKPGTVNFVIKYLSLSTNLAPEGIKVAVETVGADSITNFKLESEGKRLIQIEDIAGGTRLTDVRISPNGQYVIFTYRTIDAEGKTSYNYNVLNTKTNARLYAGAKYLSWMPKSNLLYYTEIRDGKLCFVTVNPETFAEKVWAENIPSGTFSVTPDEKSLIFLEKEAGNALSGDLQRLETPEDRQPGSSDLYFLHKFDLATGLKQRLTFGKQSTMLESISNDSRYLLFSVAERMLTERPFYNNSMFRLDMQTMKVDTLWMKDAFAAFAKFSPDGKNILILGAPEAFGGVGINIKADEIPNSYDMQAFIMNVESKKVEPITKNFDPSVNKFFWNPTDNMIYLTVSEKDYENVYRYNPQNKNFEKLNLSEEVISTLSLSGNSLMAAYSGESVSNPAKAYLLDLKTQKSTLIDNSYKEQLQQLELGEVKDWNFTSSDGTTISGRYYLPPNFDSSKKYPLIVYYYGGTSPVARTFDSRYPLHVYAAMGYVVYLLQPSGATGFGQEFSARHVNAWGKYTADEIIEGTQKFVKEHPFVNGKKIGCIGASYGGFMTMYLQTQTDLFAAAVSHAGISALSSYWGEGYWGYTYSAGASADSYPWNNKELYVEQSPLFNADKIHTPLLLLHGMEDTNVPIGESIQMYTALKILGRPVEFIQVKGENHAIRSYKRRIQWNHAIYAWFAKWLKDDPAWWDSMYPKN